MSKLNDDREFVSVLAERYADCINLADDLAAESRKKLEEAASIKKLMDIYNSRLGSNKIESTPKQLHFDIPVDRANDKLSFEEIILDILKDGKPRTSKGLLEEYSKLGKKEISVKDFSSKLSIRANNGNRLKNLKFPEYPVDQRYWWGLTDWFDGNQFKPEYEQKIRSIMGK